MRPSVRKPAPTSNGVLMDRAVRHAIYLQRHGSHLAAKTVAFLNDEVLPDVVGTLQARLDRIRSRGFDRGPWTTKRYQGMLTDVWNLVRTGARAAGVEVAKDLRALAVSESQWARGALSASTPLELDFRMPSLATVRQIVSGQPIAGAPLKDWWQSLAEDTAKRVEKAIGVGLATGETTPQIMARIAPAVDVTRTQAEAIVRTAANHVSTQAREQTYRENRDLVKAVKWVATLDSRTCPACGAKDGSVMDIDGGERPPLHPGCRCTTTPILKSWKELGIPLGEAPPGTRASMSGEVPGDLTYGEWLGNQSAEIQNDALGPKRAALFRSGDLEVGAFVDRRGKLLTLEQLRAADGQ